MPLSDDAQTWADKTYAKIARQIDKRYQEKLTQFTMGLIKRENGSAAGSAGLYLRVFKSRPSMKRANGFELSLYKIRVLAR